MFTGITEIRGKIIALEPRGPAYLLALDVPGIGSKVKLGSSVMVSGVCLSMTRQAGDQLEFEVMPETLRKTTLGGKKPGSEVNVETSLRLGDELGGHFVYGHVDGVGSVRAIQNEGVNRLLTIASPPELIRYVVAQGSVALDGVSLTVARLTDSTFIVALISDTIERTTLGTLQAGDEVNIEVDMLAKYIEKLYAR